MKSAFLVFALFAGSCFCPRGSVVAQVVTPPLIDYRLVASYPHDTTSFTEGLLLHEGDLYESTGAPREMIHTRSLFGVVDLSTGKISPRVELDRDMYFGEGIAFLDGKAYQLTYQKRVGFIYDARSFRKMGEFVIPTRDGWALSTDGHSLIMSNGTASLTWMEPKALNIVKSVSVSDNKGPVYQLNELEYINGYIYANVFGTNGIVKIDPASGDVVGRLDLSALAQEAKRQYPGAREMNGIAFDPASGTVLITGKMWPVLYRIAFTY